jgi:hypothetical protein
VYRLGYSSGRNKCVTLEKACPMGRRPERKKLSGFFMGSSVLKCFSRMR